MDDIFKIYKFGVEDAIRVAQSDNEPHQHDYEELLVGVKGQLEHFIDFRSEKVDAPFISFITEGKTHRLKPLLKDGQCEIWVIRFKSDFIADTIFRMYAQFHDQANVYVAPSCSFHRIDALCNILFEEYTQPQPDYAVVRQLLITLICKIESERRNVNHPSDSNPVAQNATFKNFLSILEAHYREARDVSFYADKLFMTVRNLNLICQQVLHQSISEIIETRKLIEAKNLLVATDKTVAEIGYALGFSEKTYFTRVFKKRVGVPPSDFRKEMKAIVDGQG